MALGDTTYLVKGTDFAVIFGFIWFEQKDLLEQINALAYCRVCRSRIHVVYSTGPWRYYLPCKRDRFCGKIWLHLV